MNYSKSEKIDRIINIVQEKKFWNCKLNNILTLILMLATNYVPDEKNKAKSQKKIVISKCFVKLYMETKANIKEMKHM